MDGGIQWIMASGLGNRDQTGSQGYNRQSRYLISIGLLANWPCFLWDRAVRAWAMWSLLLHHLLCSLLASFCSWIVCPVFVFLIEGINNFFFLLAVEEDAREREFGQNKRAKSQSDSLPLHSVDAWILHLLSLDDQILFSVLISLFLSARSIHPSFPFFPSKVLRKRFLFLVFPSRIPRSYLFPFILSWDQTRSISPPLRFLYNKRISGEKDDNEKKILLNNIKREKGKLCQKEEEDTTTQKRINLGWGLCVSDTMGWGDLENWVRWDGNPKVSNSIFSWLPDSNGGDNGIPCEIPYSECMTWFQSKNCQRMMTQVKFLLKWMLLIHWDPFRGRSQFSKSDWLIDTETGDDLYSILDPVTWKIGELWKSRMKGKKKRTSARMEDKCVHEHDSMSLLSKWMEAAGRTRRCE